MPLVTYATWPFGWTDTQRVRRDRDFGQLVGDVVALFVFHRMTETEFASRFTTTSRLSLGVRAMVVERLGLRERRRPHTCVAEEALLCRKGTANEESPTDEGPDLERFTISDLTYF